MVRMMHTVNSLVYVNITLMKPPAFFNDWGMRASRVERVGMLVHIVHMAHQGHSLGQHQCTIVITGLGTPVNVCPDSLDPLV